MCDAIKQGVIQTHFLKNETSVFIPHTTLRKQDGWTLSSLPYRGWFFLTKKPRSWVFCPLLWFNRFLLCAFKDQLLSQTAFHNKGNLFTKVTRGRHKVCLTYKSYLQVYHLLKEHTEKSSLLVKGVSISFWGSICYCSIYSWNKMPRMRHSFTFQVKSSCTTDFRLRKLQIWLSQI